MKKSVKMLLTVFSVLIAAFAFTGIKSEAAAIQITDFKQTDAGSTYAEVQWGAVAYGSTVNYRVYWGTSPSSLTGYKNAYGIDCTLFDLTPGQTYYAAVVAYSDYYKTPIAESQVIPISSAMPKVEGTRQVGATTNSITLTWNPTTGAQGYYVYRYDSYNNYAKLAETTATTATIGGLTASSEYQYFVVAYKQLTGIVTSSTYQTVYAKTVPGKGYSAKMTSFYSNINVAYYGWNSVNKADGYQFQLQNYKGKNLYTKDVSYSTSIRLEPFYKNVFTKARVRAYITVNGQNIYGEWSDYNYNASSSSVSVKKVSKGKKINVKWKKIKGCTSYTIYASKKSSSGFKKIKTLNSKKSSYTFSKIGKSKISKKKRYYIRVVYKIKVGKSTKTSQVRAEGSVF